MIKFSRLTGKNIYDYGSHSNKKYVSKAEQQNSKNRNLLLRLAFHLVTCKPSHPCQILLVWFILPLLFLAVSIGLVVITELRLPSVVPATNIDGAAKLFSEERARALYTAIPGLNVSRVIGSQINQETVVSGLLAHLESVQLKINSTKDSLLRMEILQHQFELPGYATPFVNLLARVSDQRKSVDEIDKTNSIMLSAHYDTVFPSPGGADAGSGVVTSMELLRVITEDQSVPPKYPVIFLLNNGEEAGLYGAEALSDQSDTSRQSYRWIKSVARFINLESTGAKRHAMMFRLKPSVISRELQCLPHPHATVIGEDLIDYIPNDTDFTAFTGHGHLAGFDWAFFQEGFLYHTSGDTQDRLAEGSLQELGNNILALIRYLSYQDQGSPLEQSHEDFEKAAAEKYVYFDYLGLFFVYLPQNINIAVQASLLVCAIAIPLIRFVFELVFEVGFKRIAEKRDLKERILFLKWSNRPSSKALIRSAMGLLMTFVYTLGYAFSFALGIGCALLAAVVINAWNPMVWYSMNIMLIALLFGLPCATGMVFGQFIFSQAFIQCCFVRFAYKSCWKRKNTITSDKRLYLKINKSIFSFSKERFIALNLLLGLILIGPLAINLRSLYSVTLASCISNLVTIALLFVEKMSMLFAYCCCNNWRAIGSKQVFLVDELENDTALQEIKEDDYDSEDSDHLVEVENKDTHDSRLEELASLRGDGYIIPKKTNQLDGRKKALRWLIIIPWLKHRFYWAIVPLVVNIPVMSLVAYTLYNISALLIPTLGRIFKFSQQPKVFASDIVPALLVSIFGGFILLQVLPIIHRGANMLKLTCLLLLASILSLCLLTGLGKPYDAEHPKIIRIQQQYALSTTAKLTAPDNIRVTSNSSVVVLNGIDNLPISHALNLYEHRKQTKLPVTFSDYFFAYIKDPTVAELGYQQPSIQIVNVTSHTVDTAAKTIQFEFTVEASHPSAWQSDLNLMKISQEQQIRFEFADVDPQFEAIKNITSDGAAFAKWNTASQGWSFVVSGTVPQSEPLFTIGVQYRNCEDFDRETSRFVSDFLQTLSDTVIAGGIPKCVHLAVNNQLTVDVS